MPQFHVRAAGDELTFSASHFITWHGDACERLHGHNYRVAVEVHGPLDENHYVIDFIELRRWLRAILDELDHRVLLPTRHTRIAVTVGEREVEVRHADRRWVFPRGDCLLLPVPNTTAELLAEHMGRRLLEAWQSQTDRRPRLLRVELTESNGLSAVCELAGDE